MKNKIKNIKLDKVRQDEKDMAIVLKALDIIKDKVEVEAGFEPEHFEDGDLRSSVWRAFRILENFFK